MKQMPKRDSTPNAPIDCAAVRASDWPFYEDDEIKAVADVLNSGRVNQWTGEKVKQFEAELATYFEANHAIAVANGSLALELALRALGIGAGDEVIVTPRSFVASVSCVTMVGANPVFADVDFDSQNVTAKAIAERITSKTKAIIPVHLAGWPCDMPSIMELADQHGLFVIEDCAQAHGAAIGNRRVGGFGHAAAFSFCTDKIMSTGGEGGAVLFRDQDAWRRAWEFKDHGKSLDAMSRPAENPGFRWVVNNTGTNWRLTEMQAAIGLCQLAKLEQWLARRQRNAQIWFEALHDVPALRVPWPEGRTRHAWYKFYVFTRPEILPKSTTRDVLLARLIDAGVRAFFGSCPEIYLERAFAHLRTPRLPVARALGETSLMFEVHHRLNLAALTDQAARTRELILELTR